MNRCLFPNLITLSNLVFGIVALYFTMQGLYKEAATAVLFAAVLDGMDGKIARRLNASSDFGKQLDSLSDLVSFGVAPALLIYASQLQVFGYYGLGLAIIFALCGAIRLARFNVLNITTHFVGVPITVAGPLLAIFILVSNRLPLTFFPLAIMTLSFLMVSNLKVPKL